MRVYENNIADEMRAALCARSNDLHWKFNPSYIFFSEVVFISIFALVKPETKNVIDCIRLHRSRYRMKVQRLILLTCPTTYIAYLSHKTVLQSRHVAKDSKLRHALHLALEDFLPI